jgi:hypothetical protein
MRSALEAIVAIVLIVFAMIELYVDRFLPLAARIAGRAGNGRADD